MDAARAAETEAIFRDVNEALVAQGAPPDEGPVTFLCECSNDLCAESIDVARGEYDRVRSDARRFFVCPGHVATGVESVVEQHATYWVIEKLGEAGEIAEETDPRS